VRRGVVEHGGGGLAQALGARAPGQLGLAPRADPVGRDLRAQVGAALLGLAHLLDQPVDHLVGHEGGGNHHPLLLRRRGAAGAGDRASSSTTATPRWRERTSVSTEAPGAGMFGEPWPLDSWPAVPTRVIAPREDRLFPDTNRSWSIDDRRLHFQFATEVAYEIRDGRLGRLLRDPSYAGVTRPQDTQPAPYPALRSLGASSYR
jgi:hypothetical protein